MRTGIIGIFLLWPVMVWIHNADATDEAAQTNPAQEQGSQVQQKSETGIPDRAQIVQKWGVEPLVVRLTAADHFLDFRFRVVAPDKATAVLSRKERAFLIDQKTGKVLTVSVSKIGALRGTSKQAKEGRSYVILFTNTDGTVRKGDKVTVVVGDFRVENLLVE